MTIKLSKAQREVFREMGSRGGKQTAKNRTAKQRSNASRKASNARWEKVRDAAAG